MKSLGMSLSDNNHVDMFLFQLGSLLLNKKSMNFALRELLIINFSDTFLRELLKWLNIWSPVM
jgi:hypothetical protein